MEAEKVRVVLTPLSEITEADRNVKDHDIGAIHESMNRFGFTSPLLMNEATKKLVAGHGRVEALRQKKPLKVYRDGNQDDFYDLIEENVHEGIYGINIHRATSREGGKSVQVDKWSAGCQVIAANSDFKLFMEVVNKAAKVWGNSFTYTLINSNDVV